MKKKYALLGILILLLFYPIINAYLVNNSLEIESTVERVEGSIRNYHISIWITWIVTVVVGIYYKWTTEKNFFFYFTYIFLFIGFILFGYFVQSLVNKFALPSNFEDNYTLGVFIALRNFAVAAVLTGFLQAAVWWFTRRWHRR